MPAGSPLARRIRLARTLRALREQQNVTHADLAKRSGVSAASISRIENPEDHINRKPAILVVRRLTDALGVDRGSDLWRNIDTWAEDGAAAGWWDSPAYARMGARQRTFAIVEAGAQTICDYGVSLLPGPVQTEEYARYRAQVGDAGTADVDHVVAGRMRRRQATIGSGVTYRLVLEEQPIRRRAVPADVHVRQLRDLLALAELPNVSIRVLPVDADCANGSGAAPRAPFAHISYPDPDDPAIVTVDTVTADLLITDVDEVRGYAQLPQRLREAALPDADSVAFIRAAAERTAAAQ